MNYSSALIRWDVVTTAVVFGIIQSLLIIYFFSKAGKHKSHSFLIYIIVVLLAMQLESFLLQSGYIYFLPHLFSTTIPFVFLLGPLAFLYTKSQFENFRLSRFELLHFMPFVLYFFYSFYFFLQPGRFKQIAYLKTFRTTLVVDYIPPAFSVDPLHIRGWVVVELLSLHLLVYGCLNMFLSLKKQTPPNYLSKRKRYWLIYINSILILNSFVLFLSQGGIINGKVFFESPFPYFSPDLASVLSMYLIVFYIVGNPKLFKHSDKKYANSPLPDFYKNEKLKQILLLIEREKLYLNQDFSLGMLSSRSGIRRHNISQIISEGLPINFLELTNKYRIIEAKRILETDSKIKIEKLAYELGYKSKSTFFNAFKKATGTTPLNYRKISGK